MDLGTAVVLGRVIARLAAGGVASWKAWERPGLGDEEGEALAALGQAADAARGLYRPRSPTIAAQWAETVAVAFIDAWRHHWSGQPGAEREARVPKAIAEAAVRLPEPDEALVGPALDTVDVLLADPARSQLFRRLWDSFVAAGLVVDEGEGPRAFERQFRFAWAEALSGERAAGFRDHLLALAPVRVRIAREIVARVLASWADAPAFSEPGAPPIGLRDAWVELCVDVGATSEDDDDGTEWDDEDRVRTTVRAAIEDRLRQERVVVVTGPRGSGRTHLARLLVAEAAGAWLDTAAAAPYPVYVDAAHLRDGRLDLAVRRSLRDRARDAGLDRPASDDVFAPPSADEDALIVVDGLDDGPPSRDVERLLVEIDDRASARHRFVVLVTTPPAGLAARTIPIAPLEPDQVDAWLSRWTAAGGRPRSPEDVARAIGAAPTPLLLVLDALGKGRGDPFERFVRRLAPSSGDVDALAASAWAAAADGAVDPRLGHPSVAAWLVARHWETGLRRAIRGDDGALLGGRLLAVPTAFERLLERLSGWSAADRASLVRWAQATLADDRLDVPPGEGIAADRRSPLREAALALGSVLAATSPVPGGPVGLSAGTSLRSLVAWATARSEELRVVAPRLRAMEADLSMLALPGADLGGADLSRASLAGAYAKEAVLDEAVLAGADLYRAVLRGASLAGADLSGAVLFLADLTEADLSGADLRGADLTEAILTRASLVGADLREAVLEGADLRDADLDGAALDGVDLVGAIGIVRADEE